MPKLNLPYHKTGYFSRLMCDYLSEDASIKEFYHRFPKLSEFGEQIAEKKAAFPKELRASLVTQLEQQYRGLHISEATQNHISALANENTFTVTTGHQLNLFTGPLYFLYKIFSVINLSEVLQKEYPENTFVPIYWMATEDHDFDEINYFNLFGKKVAWERESGGAVGELSTAGLEDVLRVLQGQLGKTDNAKKLSALFAKAYLDHDNLASATRYLGNELFKEYGLVIVDGNDSELKKAFIPYAEMELTKNRSFNEVNETTSRLVATGYGEQVHPREINLFYITEGIRERIIEREGTFYINDTQISFSKDQILKELENYPERFSPNALLRPLYQEVILPNLCYTGGGGELAYWFQLKDYFGSVNIPFPILLLRNSALLVPSKLSEKLDKLKVSITDLFASQHQLTTSYTKQVSAIKIDFTSQKEHLQQQFKELYQLAEQTDASFLGAVAAQEKKQLKGLMHLEKRLLKAQKRTLADRLERLTAIQDELFPGQSLQERNTNFSQFYLEYGDELFSLLKETLDPLSHQFTILEL